MKRNSYALKIILWEVISLGIFYFIAFLLNKYVLGALDGNLVKDAYEKVFDFNSVICMGLFLAFCLNYVDSYRRAVAQILFLLVLNFIGIIFLPLLANLFLPDSSVHKVALSCAVVLTGWSIYLATIFIKRSGKEHD